MVMATKRWRLAERRRMVGLSQERLAWLLEVDRTTITRWECAETEPVPRLRPKLAEALRVTDEELAALLRIEGRPRLAARRRAVGHTQEGLAEVLGVAVSTVARWEQGTGRPLPSLRRPFADALSISLDDLDRLLTGADFPPADTWAHTGRKEEDPTNRRDALRLGFAFATGALVPETAPRLGAADVERLQAAVRSLDALDSRLGGGAVLARALEQLRGVHQLLDTARYNSATGRRLQVSAGELTNMVGWLAFDAGQQDTARRFFTEALALAELAESAQLKTHVLTSMALQAATSGSGRESVDLADAAQRAARPVATPKLSSLVAAREALAHARQGDAPRSAVALASAERLLAEGDDAEDQEWLAGWGPANIYEATAQAHLHLRDPSRAAQAAQAALDLADHAHPRNEAMYLCSLAQAFVGTGDVDEAVVVTSNAVSRAETVSSERVRDRLRALRSPLEAHTAVPGVRECVDRLARL
jgi:transcriptional regulator with XRE-family HTH domain